LSLGVGVARDLLVFPHARIDGRRAQITDFPSEFASFARFAADSHFGAQLARFPVFADR
jgi:hypothetical protein